MTGNSKKKTVLKITSPIAFFIYLIIAIALFFPALNNDSLLFGTDTVSHDYLMELYGWENIVESGEIPLWMPHLFGGIPFISSFAFCPFFPTKIFSLFLKFPFAFNFQYFITAVLGGFFFFIYLKAFEISSLGALFGGMIFMLCGHFITLIYPGHLAKFQAIIGIPLAMGTLKAALDKDKFFLFLCMGIGFALSFLGSHFQIAFYSIIFTSVYLLLYLWSNRKILSVKRFLKIIIFYILGLIFGIMLSAVQVFPGIEFSSQSNRSDFVDFESASQGSFPPQETLEYILPRFTGDSVRFENGLGHYWGWWGERLVSDYIGMGTFILAIFALFMSRNKLKYFFFLSSIISLILSYGKFFFVWKFAYYYLPYFNRFRSPATIMVITSISLITLAAIGFDELFISNKEAAVNFNDEKIEKKKYKNYKTTSDFTYLTISLSLILFVISGFLFYFYHNEINQLSSKLNSGLTNIEIRNYLLIKSIMRSLIYSSMILMIISLFSLFKNYDLIKKIILGIFFIVCGIDLFNNSKAFINNIPIDQFHAFLFDKRINSALMKYPEPKRILEKNNELTNRFVLQNLSSLHGYHPVAYKKYFDLLGNLGFYNKSFLLLTNCRFLLTDNPGEVSADYKIILESGNKFLADLGDEFKFIYFPQTFKITKNDKESLEFLKKDFTSLNEQAVIIEKDARSEITNYIRKTDMSNYSYRILIFSNNKIIIDLNIPDESWCVISQYNVSGWKAILDKETILPIKTANYFFMTLKIPKGRHNIELLYEPKSFKYGAFFSIFSICVFIFLGVIHLRIFSTLQKYFRKKIK